MDEEEYRLQAIREALEGIRRLRGKAGVDPGFYGPLPQAMDELGPPGDSGALRGTAGMGGWALAMARRKKEDPLRRLAALYAARLYQGQLS